MGTPFQSQDHCVNACLVCVTAIVAVECATGETPHYTSQVQTDGVEAIPPQISHGGSSSDRSEIENTIPGQDFYLREPFFNL